MRYSYSDFIYIYPVNPLVVSMSLSSKVYSSLRTEIGDLNRDVRVGSSKYNDLAAATSVLFGLLGKLSPAARDQVKVLNAMIKRGLSVKPSSVHSSRLVKSPQVQVLLPSGNYMSDISSEISDGFADGKLPWLEGSRQGLGLSSHVKFMRRLESLDQLEDIRSQTRGS
jgi:hypothetical protein